MKNNFLQPIGNTKGEKGFTIPIVIGAIALVVVLGGIFYFASQQQSSVNNNEKAIIKDDAMMEQKEDDTIIEKEEGAMMEKYRGTVLAGKSAPLLDFTKTDYDAALKSNKLIVLYFYANWCPTCKVETANALYPVFNELTDDKVIGFRVNYNDNQTNNNEKDLAREFGVAYQHTKVFLKNGERVLKSPESWSKERYFSEISKYQ